MTDLAHAAHRELTAREKHWPAAVAASTMSAAAAEADISAWRMIAALFDAGDGLVTLALDDRPGPIWAGLIAAAQRAEDRRFDACDPATAPRDQLPALEARLGAVNTIRRALERSAWAGSHCLALVAA